MKTKRHHNNKGTRKIKNGKMEKEVRIIAKKLKVEYIDANKKETI